MYIYLRLSFGSITELYNADDCSTWGLYIPPNNIYSIYLLIRIHFTLAWGTNGHTKLGPLKVREVRNSLNPYQRFALTDTALRAYTSFSSQGQLNELSGSLNDTESEGSHTTWLHTYISTSHMSSRVRWWGFAGKLFSRRAQASQLNQAFWSPCSPYRRLFVGGPKGVPWTRCEVYLGSPEIQQKKASVRSLLIEKVRRRTDSEGERPMSTSLKVGETPTLA